MIEISIPTVVWEIINFLALSALLYFLLFRRVMRRVEERTLEKKRIMQEMREERNEAARMRKEIEERLENLEEETTTIVTKAQLQIEAEREAALKKLQEDAERILNQALEEADQLKAETVTEFHSQTVSALLEISGMVIRQVAPPELHTKLVAELFQQVWELGRSGMQQVEVLRRSLGERDPVIYVETAYPLTPEEQRTLVKTFSALADRNVNVDLKEMPSLSLGMRVRIGDLIVDNTIAAQLDKLEEYVITTLREKMPNA